MADTTTVDLKPFCGTSGPRYQLDQPWLKNGWVYATDTRIAVRVPPRLGIELGPDVTEFKRPDMEKVAGNPFGQFPLVDAVPLPDVPVSKPVKCLKCTGTGKVFDCPECEGSGEVEWEGDYSSHTYTSECYFCDGRGSVSEKKRRQAARLEEAGDQCPDCEGSGEKSDDMERIPMLGVGVATCYYRKLRALGDVTCKVYGQMVLFQCGELQGVLMIMHP